MRLLLLVVDRQAAAQHLAQALDVEHGLGRQVRQRLDHVEQIAAVAVREVDEALAGAGRERQPVAELVLGALDELRQRHRVQPVEHDDVAARQQRGVEGEGRVLGGGADQRDGAVLGLVQEPVLLGAVEAMDLVDEEDRPPAAGLELARLLEGLPQIGDAGHHRRERHQGLAQLGCQQPRQGGLAAARRPPEDHRGEPPRLQHAAQRPVRVEGRVLAHHLVEPGRPQAVGERAVLGRAWGLRAAGRVREKVLAHRMVSTVSRPSRPMPICQGRRLERRLR